MLTLPPYHCNLNPIELVWAGQYGRKRSVTPSASCRVWQILRECVLEIDPGRIKVCGTQRINRRRVFATLTDLSFQIWKAVTAARKRPVQVKTKVCVLLKVFTSLK